MLRQIRERTLAGKRLDRAEGRWLLTEAPLLDLGSVAQEARSLVAPARAPERALQLPTMGPAFISTLPVPPTRPTATSVT